MDFQSPFTHESFHSNYYQNTDTYEYSLILAISEVLLSIKDFQAQVASSSPHSMRLTNTLKLSNSNPEGFCSFFNYLPPALKKNFTPSELFSVLNEDFSSELMEFPINFASIPVNELVSSVVRTQELFDQRIVKKDAKLSMFELNWDIEVTLESVVKTLKAVPTNFQSTFNYELVGMVVSNGGFCTGVSKVKENWKMFGEFFSDCSVPWIKVAWFLVSSIKFPVILVYQRVDGHQSSLNFLSSVECEKLSQFAARQDRCFKIITKRSEGFKDELGYNQSLGLKGNIQGVKSRPAFETDHKQGNYNEQGVRSRPLYENEIKVGNFHEQGVKSRSELENQFKAGNFYDQGAKSRYKFENEPKTGNFNEQGVKSTYKFDNEPRLENIHEQGVKSRSVFENEPKLGNLYEQGVKSRTFLENEPKPGNFYEQGVRPKSYYDRNIRSEALNKSKTLQYDSPMIDEISEATRSRIELLEAKLRSPGNISSYSSIEKKNTEVLKDYPQRPRNDEFRQSGYLQNHENLNENRRWERIKQEVSSKKEEYLSDTDLKPSFTPDKYSFKTDHLKKPDPEFIDNKEQANKYRYNSVERPIGRSTYLKNDTLKTDLRDKIDHQDPSAADRTVFRAKMQNQYQNFKEKYRFLDNPESNPQKSDFSPSEVYKKEYSNQFSKNLQEPEKDSAKPLRSLYKPQIDSKSYENFSTFNPSSRAEIENSQGRKTSQLNIDEKSYYRPSKNFRAAFQDSKPTDEYLLNRSIDRTEWERYKAEENVKKNDREEIQQGKFTPDKIEYNKEKLSYKASENFSAPYKDPEPLSQYNLNKSIDNEDFKRLNKYKNSSVERQDQYHLEFSKNHYHAKRSNEGTLNKNTNEPLRKKYLSHDSTPVAVPNIGESFEKDIEVRGNAEISEWKCARCGKGLSHLVYECTECRLINWDQFYKVKSIQQPNKSEVNQHEIQISRYESSKSALGNFKVNDDESDWVCTACYNTNKGLFFLCKNCRKPKTFSDGNKVSKEYN